MHQLQSIITRASEMKYFLVACLSFIFIVLNLSASVEPQYDDCEYYLSFSSKRHGRKLVAGKDIAAGSVLFFDPSVFAPKNWTGYNMLSKYVFSSADSEVAVILLGSRSLMNHSPNPNTNHFWDDDLPPFPKDFPERRYGNNKAFTIATKDIAKGEEFFCDYGSSWFADHGLEEINLGSADSEQQVEKNTEENRVCLSGFQMYDSQFPQAGQGLFSTRAYKKDELITVSPTILLASFDLRNSLSSTVIVNYCFYKPGSAVALLPLGYSSMMNHYQTMTGSQRSKGKPREEKKRGPNVYTRWFNWDLMLPEEDNAFLTEGRDLISLIKSPFAPLDLAFYASRDIPEGQELTLDYGKEWAAAYQTVMDDPSSPFRHWIGGADNLFPDEWMTDSNCADTENHPLFCFPDLEEKRVGGQRNTKNREERSQDEL
jgi:hypothetical protein